MEQMRKEQDKLREVQKQQDDEIAVGNPLINNDEAFSLKRKWNEETVFKNQARNQVKSHKRFINDTVRSDFHRKFMSKYIQ